MCVGCVGGVGSQARGPGARRGVIGRKHPYFLKLIVDDEKKLKIDLEDDIVKACLVARDGQVLREQKA